MDKQLEVVLLFIGKERIYWFRDSGNFARQACVTEPPNCFFEFATTSAFSDVAQDKSPIFL